MNDGLIESYVKAISSCTPPRPKENYFWIVGITFAFIVIMGSAILTGYVIGINTP